MILFTIYSWVKYLIFSRNFSSTFFRIEKVFSILSILHVVLLGHDILRLTELDNVRWNFLVPNINFNLFLQDGVILVDMYENVLPLSKSTLGSRGSLCTSTINNPKVSFFVKFPSKLYFLTIWHFSSCDIQIYLMKTKNFSSMEIVSQLLVVIFLTW